ncbi:MAG: hypothetical protein ABMA01_17400, partial [Chthoniobacteraceae bacterium]
MTLNLTGDDASDADVAAFVADDSPDALAKLTARFQSLPPLARYAGWLKAGEQTFKVTSAPADYRGTVMTANGSGLYEVTDSVFLQHYGKHANLVFMPPSPVRHPHTIHVKDKEDRRVPHGIVWRHGSGVVWVAEKTRVRKFDFTMPGKLTETELPAGIASIPGELRAELVKAFPAVETAAATETPKGAEPRRKVDWSKFPVMDKLANPYNPEATLKLAAKVKQSRGDIRELMVSILQAAAEKAAELQPLLQDEELKRRDDEHHSLALALAAYDYSLNGNRKALQFLMDELAKQPLGGDPQAVVPLGYIDEWDVSPIAQLKQFCMSGDVASSVSASMFWDQREYLYPEKLALFEKKSEGAPKLDPKSLQGVWKGSKHGVTVELRVGEKISWEIKHGDRLAAAELVAGPKGSSLEINKESPDKKYQIAGGVLFPGEAGTLSLQLSADFPGEPPRYPGVKDLILKRQEKGGSHQPGGAMKPARKVDWSKPPPMSFFEGKYDPELLARLAAKPNNEGGEIWRLSEQILRAAVEKAPQFRHLISDEKLKSRDIESRILTLSLAAYDYSVFGNKDGLKTILNHLGSGHPEAYIAAFPLGFVDEWDESIPAMEKCFAQGDGAKGEEDHRFWIHRQWLFPESFAAFEKKQVAAMKLDADSLRGVWKGRKDGVSVTLRFGENQGWEVRKGEAVMTSELSTEPVVDARQLNLVGPDANGLIQKLIEANVALEGQTTVHRGTLRPVKDGTMTLYIRGDFGRKLPTGYPRVNDLILTKETEQAKGADAVPRSDDAEFQPKHEYAQSLFRKWQASARTDGKIPGALIGHVAREVDRFIKQSPDSEESKKLAALRLRLDASRDWAQAEAVALLDDITAISTAPVSWADIPMQFDKARAVQGGEALPIELKSAAWGQPMANGLRAA